MVDLPTPPLPEAMQITFSTWASEPRGRGRTARPSRWAEVLLLVLREGVEADVDPSADAERRPTPP